jgi:hypothetical protein
LSGGALGIGWALRCLEKTVIDTVGSRCNPYYASQQTGAIPVKTLQMANKDMAVSAAQIEPLGAMEVAQTEMPCTVHVGCLPATN